MMRTFTAAVLLLLATLVAPLVIGGTWVTQRIDDREAYVDTVAGIARNPIVQQTLADASADAAVDALQKHAPVADPEMVHEWAVVAALKVVEGDVFANFWDSVNGDIHDQLFAVLKDADGPADGSITVDASPLVAQVLLQLQEHGVAVVALPEVSLRVPVLAEAKVAEAGPAYRTVDGILRFLPVAWAGLALLAILVARGGRGRLRVAGLALVGAGAAALLILLGVGPLADMAIDTVDVSARELAGVMIDVVLDSLKPHARLFLWALPIGVVLFVATLLPRRRRGGSPDQAHPDQGWGQPVA